MPMASPTSVGGCAYQCNGVKRKQRKGEYWLFLHMMRKFLRNYLCCPVLLVRNLRHLLEALRPMGVNPVTCYLLQAVTARSSRYRCPSKDRNATEVILTATGKPINVNCYFQINYSTDSYTAIAISRHCYGCADKPRNNSLVLKNASYFAFISTKSFPKLLVLKKI